MTAQGGDILAYLDTAIRDREHIARLAESEGGQQWSEDPFVFGVRDQTHTLAIRVRENRTQLLAHIALSDPESVLRRCAADRKLLAEVRRTAKNAESRPWDPASGPWAEAMLHAAKVVAEGYGWTEGER